MSNYNQSFIRYLGVLVVLAGLLRLPAIMIYPPGTESVYPLRLLTASAAIVSIVLFVLLIRHISNARLALVSGLVLTLMPWHIEQSRIYSSLMLVLVFLLAGCLTITYVRSTVIRCGIVGLTLMGIYFVYPSAWWFISPLHRLSADDLLNNFFKLTSAEFLFYKNDSFWKGGSRTVGGMFPSWLPIFVLGGLLVCKRISRKNYKYGLGALGILLLAILNPQFPEAREIFLITPYLALISGLGVVYILEHINSSNKLILVLLTVYSVWIVYDLVLFYHTYTVHYASRIKNERSYETKTF